MIVTSDRRHEIVPNTDELRAWVLGMAGQIRAARRQLAEINPAVVKAIKVAQNVIEYAIGARICADKLIVPKTGGIKH